MLTAASTSLSNGKMFGEDVESSKLFFGLLSTLLSLGYGFGKFILANVTDRSNARYMLASSLIITAFLNIFLGLLTYKLKWLMIIIVMLIGWFQGACWPAVARIFSHWYVHRERAKYIAIHSMSHNIAPILLTGTGLIGGGLISYSFLLFSGLLGTNLSYFILPSMITILIAFWVLLRLKDTPQEAGLPHVEAWKGEVKLSTKDTPEQHWKKILKEVLKNPSIWILGIAQISINILRLSFLNWILFYVRDNFNINTSIDSTSYTLVELGAIPGTIIAGFLTDFFFNKVKYFKNHRSRFLFLTTIALVPLWLVFFFLHNYIIVLIFCFLWGFTLYPSYTTTGAMGMEYVSKKHAGSATGFMGFLSYAVASIISGRGIAQLIVVYGYISFHLMFLLSIIILIFCSLLLWNKKVYSLNDKNKKTIKKKRISI